MSFLERREADKAARDRQAAQKNLAQQQAQARQEEARAHARELEAQRIADGQQARAYLQGSLAENMLRKLALTIEGSHFLPAAMPYMPYGGNPTKSVTSLIWDRKYGRRVSTYVNYEAGHYHEWGRYKEIQIEADSKGTITIKGGGLFGSGSTTLTREQAKNPKLVEQALEKAYTHPRIERYRNA